VKTEEKPAWYNSKYGRLQSNQRKDEKEILPVLHREHIKHRERPLI